MTQTSWPPIPYGTRVLTRWIPDGCGCSNWNREARERCRFGVIGTVIRSYDGHGRCYDVQHSDGTVAPYEPDELVVQPKPGAEAVPIYYDER